MDKTCIILAVKNLKEITQTCVDSIKSYSKNYELIIVDDGSDNETQKYLESVADKYIRHEKSLGWVKSINDGFEVADGDYVIAMNNDTVVTPEWLGKLLYHFSRNEKIGVITPTTNKAIGREHIDFNKNGVEFEEAKIFMGFCMVFKKEVLNKLKEKDGFWLDPRFGLGGQDDLDIVDRVNKLGYISGIARDVFVYHMGSGTFREEFNNDISKSKEFAVNQNQILQNKKPKVFIYVPNLGEISPELTKRLIHYSHNQNYEVHIELPQGMLPLDNARSHCVKWFMEQSNNEYDRLWFIDADIIPPYEGLDVLMQHDQDVCGLLCFMQKPDDSGQPVPLPVAVRYDKNKQYKVFFNGNGLTEVDAVGGGCIMTKRKVFEDIGGRPYEFHYYPDGTLKLVGDYDFCQKVQKAGYKIMIDFNNTCEHMKKVGLRDINNLMVKIQNG